jgi:hypothetical protein
LTYPQKAHLRQRRERAPTRLAPFHVVDAKSLISLKARDCSESGQATEKRPESSVFDRGGGVLHKVIHSCGGKLGNPNEISGLPEVVAALSS